MRLKSVLLASCVGAVGLCGASPAEAGGLYGSILGGYDIPSAGKINRAFSTTVGTSTNYTFSSWSDNFSKPENGFMLAVAIGYDLSTAVTPGLKVELEGGYRHNNVKGALFAFYSTLHSGSSLSTSASASATGADFTTWSLMANAWYEFDTGGKLRPFVGGGVGWARTKFNPEVVSGGLFRPSEDEGFAWQLGAGINWHLSPHGSIGLGYRYFRTDDLDITINHFNLFSPPQHYTYDGSHQDITLSITYDLN